MMKIKINGENVIRLYTCKWFDPMDGEYLYFPEWWEGELIGRIDDMVDDAIRRLEEDEEIELV